MPPERSTLAVAVLAAGEGTRMRSALPKVLHPVCGRPMLRLVLDVADSLEPVACTLILAPDTIEPIRAELGPRYGYAQQRERRGTGHALLQARELLLGRAQRVLVLYGDTPLLKPETVQRLLAAAEGRLVALLSFVVDPPTGYGRVVRNAQGQVLRIVEERNATAEERLIQEANSGILCFDAAWLWEELPKLAPDPVRNEFYLTDMIGLAVAQAGAGAVVAIAGSAEEAWGVNDRAQLAGAEAILRKRLLQSLFEQGVTIIDPASVSVDVGVQIGRDSVIYPGTVLRGSCRIGAGCEIGPHVLIQNASLGDGCRVRQSVIEDVVVPAASDVGPFAHLSASRGSSA